MYEEKEENIWRRKINSLGEGKGGKYLEKENMSLRRRRITGIEFHRVRKKSDASQDTLRLVPD